MKMCLRGNTDCQQKMYANQFEICLIPAQLNVLSWEKVLSGNAIEQITNIFLRTFDKV